MREPPVPLAGERGGRVDPAYEDLPPCPCALGPPGAKAGAGPCLSLLVDLSAPSPSPCRCAC